MLIHTLNCTVISTNQTVQLKVWYGFHIWLFCSAHTLRIPPSWQRDSFILVHICWVTMTCLTRRSSGALLHGSRLFHWVIVVCFLRSGLHILCFDDLFCLQMIDGTVRSTGISTDISTARSNGHNGKITIVMNRSMVTSLVSRLVKTSVCTIVSLQLLLEKRLRHGWVDWHV